MDSFEAKLDLQGFVLGDPGAEPSEHVSIGNAIGSTVHIVEEVVGAGDSLGPIISELVFETSFLVVALLPDSVLLEVEDAVLVHIGGVELRLHLGKLGSLVFRVGGEVLVGFEHLGLLLGRHVVSVVD